LRHKAGIRFLTKSDETVASMIRDSGFPVTRADTDATILANLQADTPDVIVFDKIDVDEGLARDIRGTLDSRLVIFTNLTDANKYADVAVTADIGSQFQNVNYTDETT